MLNKIFGNSRAERTDWSVISSIIRAEARLQSKGEIAPSRRAGIVFRNDDSIDFLHDLDRELDAVLYSGPDSTRTAFEIVDDEQGMRWVILEDGVFEDLVSSIYTVGNAMGAKGADRNLLAAVFELYFTGALEDGARRSGIRTYWIYRYDRKAFYPFVPTGDKTGERDRPAEVALSGRAGRQGLSIERDVREWMGLWGIPF